MDLRTHLLALLAPLAPGDEILPGVRLRDASTELGLRLSFELADGADAHVEVAPADPPGPHAARTAALRFGYRGGDAGAGGDAQLDPRTGVALCRAVAARAAAREREVLAAIALDARAGSDGSTGRDVADGSADDSADAPATAISAARVREVRVARLLEPAGSPARRYYTLSPYVGCLIGCRFCYAQQRVGTVRALAGLAPAPWGSYVDVRVNAPEVLAHELAALPPRPIKFCPVVSDPYHALERARGLTRACLEVLRAAPPEPRRAVLVLTRARLVERDAALLAAIPRAYAGLSVPTDDDAVRAHFEPRAAPIAARLAALAALRAAGVRTFAIVQPLLPGGPVERLADALASVVDSVRIDVLRGVEGAAELFADPRYAAAREPAWQLDRADALARALAARGVRLWPEELPPDEPAAASR